MVMLTASTAVLYIDAGSLLSIERSVQCTRSGIEIVLRHQRFHPVPAFHNLCLVNLRVRRLAG